jgi:spoIIIJ-associated protein
MEKEIKELLTELFELIGVKASFNITLEDDFYKIEVEDTESAGLLIGAHGLTLSAIQSFLTIAMKQKTGEWVKISLDIANWSKKQNDRLTDLAKETADRARQTGEEQRLYNLNGQARRMVHMALSETAEIETLSEGEGENRYLIVRVKTSKK